MCKAGHTKTFTQQQLLFDERHKAGVVSSSAGPSQDGSRVAELKVVLEVKEKEHETLADLAAKDATGMIMGH